MCLSICLLFSHFNKQSEADCWSRVNRDFRYARWKNIFFSLDWSLPRLFDGLLFRISGPAIDWFCFSVCLSVSPQYAFETHDLFLGWSLILLEQFRSISFLVVCMFWQGGIYVASTFQRSFQVMQESWKSSVEIDRMGFENPGRSRKENDSIYWWKSY